MKVKEMFEEESIDTDFIFTHFDGSYWDSCSTFVAEVWDRDYESLSQGQGRWLTKILDDCVEKRIEG